MRSEKRIPGLDGIRALSIILVLFDHAADGVSTWSRYGGFGVEAFFVLSGFLITWLLCVEEDTRGTISLPSFYARRSLRILPPAFLCIACVSLLGSLGWADLAPNEPLYSALFVRNLMPNGGLHLGHFWSLAIEEQFYLLWPVAFLLLRSNRRRLIFTAALIVVAPFWRQAMYGLAGGATYVNSWRFDIRYDALMAGCCLALLRYDRELRRLASHHVLTSTPVALAALGAIVAGCAGLPVRALSSSLSFIGVAAFINFSVETPSGLIGSFLNWGPMVWIGQLSYSLYLWQQIFCWRSKLPWIGQFPQNIIAAFSVAAFSYYLLERPLGDVRRRIPYLSNPRLVYDIIASGARLHSLMIAKTEVAVSRTLQTDVTGDVIRLLNAVKSSQPEPRDVKSESLQAQSQKGPR
jgi:peptidoglycan/LPS O-acetylase OafA/YrhL